jgi:hypothetical protein
LQKQINMNTDPNFKYELGLEAEDIVTGFKGIIEARIQFITGCNNYKLQPKGQAADGKLLEPALFDENRIKVIGKGVNIPGGNTPEKKATAQKKDKGGPQSLPQRRKL